MDPLTMITAASQLIGMGMQFMGGSKASDAANRAAGIEKNILGEEQQENELRQQAMRLSASRQRIESIRRTQQVKAMDLAAGVNQGALYGSGVAGGQAGATAAGAFNTLGINQNEEVANNIFSTDRQIGNLKMQLADAQTGMFNAQGMLGIGKGIFEAAPMIGRLGANFMGGFNFNGGQKGNDLG